MREQFTIICERLRTTWGDHFDEHQTKTEIIEPVLECFGWDVSQENEMVKEWRPPTSGNRQRIDYAFFPHQDAHLPVVDESRPVILLEAKRTGTRLGSRGLSQLTEYIMRHGGARHDGMAVLTNGAEWWFFSTIGLEDLTERFAYKVNLVTSEPPTSYQDMGDFLRRDHWLRRVAEGSIWDTTNWKISPPSPPSETVPTCPKLKPR